MSGLAPIEQHSMETACAAAKLRAQAVLHDISIALQYDGQQDTQPDPVHQIFIDLYYCTTHRWLEHLSDQDEPMMAYLVIDQFYQLYDRYVAKVIAGCNDEIPPQWRPYFALADRASGVSLPWHQFQLAFLGARAHTRYDLAEAIFGAWQAYRRTSGREADIGNFRKLMLGDATSPVFFQAAVDFTSLRRSGRDGLTSQGTQWATQLMQHFWVPAFQSWRHAAWRDAEIWMAQAVAGSTIDLLKHPLH